MNDKLTVEIHPVHKDDIPDGNMQAAEIQFDCLVTMYEMGARTFSTGLFGMEEKSHKPQWFRNRSKLTLDMIRNDDPAIIGRQIKMMLRQLDAHIKQYEDKKF